MLPLVVSINQNQKEKPMGKCMMKDKTKEKFSDIVLKKPMVTVMTSTI